MMRKLIDLDIIVASLFLFCTPMAGAADAAQAAMAEYKSGHYAAALTQFVALEKQYPNSAMAH
ncbi:hypothetical protein ABTC69_18545, partial [Acinetobacter baumannii]